jgi:hypothetical protein
MSAKAILLIIVFAVATAVSSPASARSSSRAQAYDSETGTYAHHVRRHHSAYRSRAVYNIRGRYRGADPDPFIRDQLRRCREC